MNYDLPDELKMLRDMARRFAAEQIRPNARDWDREGAVPEATVKRLAELGFMGVFVPQEYGGAGIGYVGMTVIMEEIARQCGGTALMLAAHNGLCLGHMLLAASDVQRKKYLPDLASGKMLGAWALTEPGSGSDAGLAHDDRGSPRRSVGDQRGEELHHQRPPRRCLRRSRTY